MCLTISLSLSFSLRKSSKIQKAKERSLHDKVKCPLNLIVLVFDITCYVITKRGCYVENTHLEFQPSLLSQEELEKEISVHLESGFFYIALTISIDRFIPCYYFIKFSSILDVQSIIIHSFYFKLIVKFFQRNYAIVVFDGSHDFSCSRAKKTRFHSRLQAKNFKSPRAISPCSL